MVTPVTFTIVDPLIGQPIQDKTQLGYSFLESNRFQLVIDRCPNVSFYCQAAPIPAVSVPSHSIGTPFVDYPVTGNKLNFDDFVVTFMIDAMLSNYYEIWRWIIGYAGTDNYNTIDDYIAAVAQGQYRREQVLEKYLVSDMILLILDPNGKEVGKVKFKNAFPVSLQGLNFDTTPTGVNYLTGVVTFKYTNYEIDLTPIEF